MRTKTFENGSLVLDFGIWWFHKKIIYRFTVMFFFSLTTFSLSSCYTSHATSTPTQFIWYLASRAIVSIVQIHVAEKLGSNRITREQQMRCRKPMWPLPSKRCILEHFYRQENTLCTFAAFLDETVSFLICDSVFHSVKLNTIYTKQHTLYYSRLLCQLAYWAATKVPHFFLFWTSFWMAPQVWRNFLSSPSPVRNQVFLGCPHFCFRSGVQWRAVQEMLPGSLLDTCLIHLHHLHMIIVPILSWFQQARSWLEMVSTRMFAGFFKDSWCGRRSRFQSSSNILSHTVGWHICSSGTVLP